VLAAIAWAILGWRGLIVWGGCMTVTVAVSAYVYRKIGGATGDTFGAVCELAEVVPALMLTIEPLSEVR
jgi:adenosylcobinamide-GDP ribazoletransferase